MSVITTPTRGLFDIVSCPIYILDILKNHPKSNPKQIRNLFEYEDFYSYQGGYGPQKKSDLFVRVGLHLDREQGDSIYIENILDSLSSDEDWPHNGTKINKDVYDMVDRFIKINHLDDDSVVQYCHIIGLSKDLEWFEGIIPSALFISWEDA